MVTSPPLSLVFFSHTLILVILLTLSPLGLTCLLVGQSKPKSNYTMSQRQTRQGYRSELDLPSSPTRRRVESDEEESSSADESDGPAWNPKNDGANIEQSHFGKKRSRRGRSVKRESKEPSSRSRRKRSKSESVDDVKIEPMEPEETSRQDQEETPNDTTGGLDEGQDEGNRADTEDIAEVQETEPETTIRKSGRARKAPERLHDDSYLPYGIPSTSSFKTFKQGNTSKAMSKLKEARTGAGKTTSRGRKVSDSGSPDPIALFSDDNHPDIIMGSPVHYEPTEPGLAQQEPEHNYHEIDASPLLSVIPSHDTKPAKSALKQKKPEGPTERKGVTIDETKNQTRTIKIVSSTSSDIDRSPSLPTRGRGPGRGRGRGRGRGGRGRGGGQGGRGGQANTVGTGIRRRRSEGGLRSMVFGVRSRNTVPVIGFCPETGEKRVERYEYALSSSSESEEPSESEIDTLVTDPPRSTAEINGDRLFLLSLAARVSDTPSSSSLPPLPSQSSIDTYQPNLVFPTAFLILPFRPRPRPPMSLEQQADYDQQLVRPLFYPISLVDLTRQRWDTVVDCASYLWDAAERIRLQQVVIFRPPPLPATYGGKIIHFPDCIEEPEDSPLVRDDPKEVRRELIMLAGPQASLPEPIIRPGLNFEKATERLTGLGGLAGLEIANCAMGMRLHIPETRKSIKF
jgi:hypothetical protein